MDFFEYALIQVNCWSEHMITYKKRKISYFRASIMIVGRKTSIIYGNL